MADVQGYSPLDIQGAIAWGRNAVPDYAARQLAEREMAVREGTLGYQQQQESRLTAKQQADAAALAEQRSQAEAMLRDPSPTNLFNYAVRNPGVANELKASWEMQDTATRHKNFDEMASTYAMALRDRKKAAEYFRGRSTAGDERDDEDEAMADLLDSDKPEEWRKAYADMGLKTMIASGDMAKFEETMRKYYIPEYSDIAGGDLIVEKNWGDVGLNPYGKVTPGPAGFYPYAQPGGIPVFGGGTTQAGGATATPTTPTGTTPTRTGGGVRSMGLTPRESVGGDNSNAAVDGKLSVIGTRTGLGIDAPLTGKDIPKFVDAYIASEGGGVGARPGVNNPGNIKDGSFARSQPGYAGHEGAFAKFNTPAQGRAAITKLVGQKFLKGHKTIRDMIEGKVDTARVKRDAALAIKAGRDPAAVKAMAAQMGVQL